MELISRLGRKVGIVGLAAVFALSSISGCFGPKRHYVGLRKEVVSRDLFASPKSSVENASLSIRNLVLNRDEEKGKLSIRGKASFSCDLHQWNEREVRVKAIRMYSDGSEEVLSGHKEKRKEKEKIVHKEFIPRKVSFEATRRSYRNKTITYTERVWHGSGFFSTATDEKRTETLRIPVEKIRFNFAPAEVEADGDFKIRYSDPDWKRESHKYYSFEATSFPLFAKIDEVIPGSSTRVSARTLIGSVKVHSKTGVNETAIKNFIDREINSKIFSQRIRAIDYNTHLPVRARIVVDCTNSIDTSKVMEREFTNDGELCRYGVIHLDECLEASESCEQTGQSVSFQAIEGATYRVRTFHPNYHHVNATFTADRNHPKKSIQLVETGEKIRLDTTKEGAGGLINEE